MIWLSFVQLGIFRDIFALCQAPFSTPLPNPMEAGALFAQQYILRAMVSGT